MANKRNSKALIIQPGAIGDSILTLPLVRLLRQEGRFEAVDFLAHHDKTMFLPGRSDVHEIIPIEQVELHRLFQDSNQFLLDEKDSLLPVFRDYDLIVTFLYDDAGHFERNLVYLTAMSHSPDIATVKLRPPGDYTGHVADFFMEQFVQEVPYALIRIRRDLKTGCHIRIQSSDRCRGWQILESHGVKPAERIVLLHPGSGGQEKCWPVAHFRETAQVLSRQGFVPLLLIGPVEEDLWDRAILQEIGSEFTLLRDLTLEDVTAVLSCCSGYIGNDSGITHLAGAMGLVTLALFGPSNPVHWHPLGDKSTICRGTEGNWVSVDRVVQTLETLLASTLQNKGQKDEDIFLPYLS